MRGGKAPIIERHPIFNSRDTEEARAFLHATEFADFRSGLDAPISGRWGGLSSVIMAAACRAGRVPCAAGYVEHLSNYGGRKKAASFRETDGGRDLGGLCEPQPVAQTTERLQAPEFRWSAV